MEGRDILSIEGGVVDFSPELQIGEFDETGLPLEATAGSIGDEDYSPLLRLQGTYVVYNAPIIATGSMEELNQYCDQTPDEEAYTFLHDTIFRICPRDGTVTFKLLPSFAQAKPTLVLSMSSSNEILAALSNSTFVPLLGELSIGIEIEETEPEITEPIEETVVIVTTEDTEETEFTATTEIETTEVTEETEFTATTEIETTEVTEETEFTATTEAEDTEETETTFFTETTEATEETELTETTEATEETEVTETTEATEETEVTETTEATEETEATVPTDETEVTETEEPVETTFQTVVETTVETDVETATGEETEVTVEQTVEQTIIGTTEQTAEVTVNGDGDETELATTLETAPMTMEVETGTEETAEAEGMQFWQQPDQIDLEISEMEAQQRVNELNNALPLRFSPLAPAYIITNGYTNADLEGNETSPFLQVHPLRQGLGNVEDEGFLFPVLSALPGLSPEYSPLWEVYLLEWSQTAIENEFRTQVREEMEVLSFVYQALLSSVQLEEEVEQELPQGDDLLFQPSGIVVNFPVVIHL